jgi:hypothetical protein
MSEYKYKTLNTTFNLVTKSYSALLVCRVPYTLVGWTRSSVWVSTNDNIVNIVYFIMSKSIIPHVSFNKGYKTVSCLQQTVGGAC